MDLVGEKSATMEIEWRWVAKGRGGSGGDSGKKKRRITRFTTQPQRARRRGGLGVSRRKRGRIGLRRGRAS